MLRTVLIRGGEYSYKVELKALVSTILRRLFPPESREYVGVLGHAVKLRISQYKTLSRRVKGARGTIVCYHHESAAKVLNALQNADGFHAETRFLATDFVQSRPSNVCEPRYKLHVKKN